MMDRDALLRGMFGGEEGLHSFTVSHEAEQERLDFDFHSAYLYLFHTQVAFLCLGLRFSRIRTLRQICSPGSAENHACYHCLDSRGQEREFSLNLQLTALCAWAGLRGFFPSSPSLLLEEYIYSVAVVPQRFPSLESMRQAAFNLHMISPVESMAEDDSEEDVRYVYAVKNQELGGTYRWGCCVSSQTISYVVADREMDIDGEMVTQAQDGLPMILVALYEKYTCLRFTELLTLTDKKRMKRLRALKKLMLEFRAYARWTRPTSPAGTM